MWWQGCIPLHKTKKNSTIAATRVNSLGSPLVLPGTPQILTVKFNNSGDGVGWLAKQTARGTDWLTVCVHMKWMNWAHPACWLIVHVQKLILKIRDIETIYIYIYIYISWACSTVQSTCSRSLLGLGASPQPPPLRPDPLGLVTTTLEADPAETGTCGLHHHLLCHHSSSFVWRAHLHSGCWRQDDKW